MPDSGYWYIYLPLRELGHEVVWYDTVAPEEKDYGKIIDLFKPDLIFCCLTNDREITPHEPWELIERETKMGRTKTFNWFCDDTWRFDNFSSRVCHMFTACSTPEPSYIEKYKNIGYNNILLATWHANSNFYPKVDFKDKDIDLSFIGYPTPGRKKFFEACDLPIDNAFGLSQDEMFSVYSRAKMGLNLCQNDNDREEKTQMKQRMFEIPAGAGALITEYHEGIEEFFEVDREIITFKTMEELTDKANFFLKNPAPLEKVANNGHKRFLAEHDSKVRLAKLLKQIEDL
jgi:spore maturation protein CgeB